MYILFFGKDIYVCVQVYQLLDFSYMWVHSTCESNFHSFNLQIICRSHVLQQKQSHRSMYALIKKCFLSLCHRILDSSFKKSTSIIINIKNFGILICISRYISCKLKWLIMYYNFKSSIFFYKLLISFTFPFLGMRKTQ